MSQKLLVARVHFDMVIAVDEDSTYAENTALAQAVVSEAILDMSSSEFDIEFELFTGSNAEGWDGMCVPYGGDGNTRIKDYGL
jgi:hypothetical protein